MNATELFNRLWDNYSFITPSAQKVKDLFEREGEVVFNDHIAFRTLNDSRLNKERVSTYLLELGFVNGGTYHFPEKKLVANHFYHPTNADLPKVFISELLMEEFSETTQAILRNVLNEINWENLNPLTFLTGGRLWSLPSYETYQALRNESEYAAWFYLYGFTANHFTVDANKLNNTNTLEEVNNFLEANNYRLNASGGKIKGGTDVYLEQSSTIADLRPMNFEEGVYEVPTCFYEFAYRHNMENGELFQGFVAASANKIFESTDLSLQ